MKQFLMIGLSVVVLTGAIAEAAPVAPSASTTATPTADAPQIGEIAVPAVPHPYDEDADATKAVDAALAAAKAEGKRALIVFGANWCGDCKAFAGVLTVAPVKAWADRHYQIVEVNVGRFNRNTDLAARFGLKLTAIPALVVVAPDGKVVNGSEMLALGDARSMTPQAVVDILARWAVAPPAS